ncbi:hypothetical protein B0T16DRAFT_494994 [Cercophora newfieldiana]|uniref:MYND-type domain-containing protein n=1 Tax=Cercophora newfieldiana TaxID=92897 RepID=A0AA39Y159_9PEZI|nr:hypothetical protein B0T16DRAFT_494994 [Cercophora newfieldiana]
MERHGTHAPPPAGTSTERMTTEDLFEMSSLLEAMVNPMVNPGQPFNPEGMVNPLDALFKHLPRPRTDYAARNAKELHDSQLMIAAATYLSTCPKSDCTDPDHKFVQKRSEMLSKRTGWEGRAGFLLIALAELAITKTIPDDDLSLKAQHLRYLKWIVRGRKDEESPFGATAPTRDHRLLSSSNSPCAACGKTGVPMTACSDCIYRTEDTITFSTNYCSKSCQKAHWSKHKDYCVALRRVHRSVSIFQQLYTMFAEMVSEPKDWPIKVWEDPDTKLTMVQPPDGKMTRHWGYRGQHSVGKFQAPENVAPSSELKMALMMSGRSLDLISDFEALLEWFLAFGFLSAKVVSVMPKNIHLPLAKIEEPNGIATGFSGLRMHTVIGLVLSGSRGRPI